MAIIDTSGEQQATDIRLPSLYPRLAYNDERAALAYLVRVFGFVEIREARVEHDGHMLAWIRMGDGVVMLGHAQHDIHRIYSPGEVGHTTVIMMVDVDNIEDHYRHAQEQGADITMELDDAYYGERRYEATDPEGHRWHFGERFDKIRARGGDVPDE